VNDDGLLTVFASDFLSALKKECTKKWVFTRHVRQAQWQQGFAVAKSWFCIIYWAAKNQFKVFKISANLSLPREAISLPYFYRVNAG